MLLTKDQILASSCATERVDVPEWGGEVLVADFGGDGRDLFERWCLDHKGERFVGVRAALAAFAIVGEDGAPVFSADDIAALGKKSGAALDRVYDVASRLNRLTKKDAENLEKNSGSATTEGSPSV